MQGIDEGAGGERGGLAESGAVDFAQVAAKGRMQLAFEVTGSARKVSSPLLAFESPSRTDTFAMIDAFIQAAWECDQGDAVLRQDLTLIEHHLSGKRVPSDTLLAYLAVKTYLDPRDDVKSLIESYMAALQSERKRSVVLDWTMWQGKYAHLVYLYISCLFYSGQVEAAQSALEPHRVDSLLLTEPARRKLEATLAHWIKLSKPPEVRPGALELPKAIPAGTSAPASQPAAQFTAQNRLASGVPLSGVVAARLAITEWSRDQPVGLYAAGAAAVVALALIATQRQRLAAVASNVANLLFGADP